MPVVPSKLRRTIGWMAAATLLLVVHMRLLARADPVLRSARLHVAGWHGPPARIVLLADLHVAAPDMSPARLGRLVRRVNRLAPDLVLIAGDLLGEGYFIAPPPAEAVRAPLGGLRARRGVLAVLGNHDHWTGAAAARAALGGAGVTVLDNRAVRRGPFAVGGVDDDYTGHARLAPTLAEMKRAGGLPILLTHSPDPFAKVPAWVVLTLAGHTHCGQVRVPFVPPLTATRTGAAYACGVVRAGARTLIVSGGVGTSLLPLRLGARPDLWVIDVGA